MTCRRACALALLFTAGAVSSWSALGAGPAEGHAAAEPRSSGPSALSGDGRWQLAATADARTLVLFDAQRQPVKSFAVATLDGQARSRVAQVLDAPLRKCFIVALQDIAELWEISYDPQAAPIYDGLVHDYKMGEGIAKPGTFNIRRTPLEEPLGALILDAAQHQVLGVVAAAAGRSRRAQIINLDIRRKIAELPADSLPPPAAGSRFTWQGGVLRFHPAAAER